jgi:glutamyl aminopeptidase
MNLDATLGSHPIVQKVENPDQITAIFDTITYSKGASVIRMMEDFVGPENFRQGVQNYLNKHAFKNAVTDDLLTELNLLNLGYDVDQVMSTWTKQKGLPVINVERIGQSSYRLTQKRFLADPDNEGKENDSDYNYRWYIPITYISSADKVTVQREWFKNDDNWVEITVDPTSTWLKINNDQVGYYRVKYEYEMWFKLSAALETDIESMSTLNRAHLLNDAFSLAEARQIQYEIPLTMTGYLKQEREYVPWAVAASKLKSIATLMQKNSALPKLKEYVRGLLTDVYGFVGWTLGENHSNK